MTDTLHAFLVGLLFLGLFAAIISFLIPTDYSFQLEELRQNITDLQNRVFQLEEENTKQEFRIEWLRKAVFDK